MSQGTTVKNLTPQQLNELKTKPIEDDSIEAYKKDTAKGKQKQSNPDIKYASEDIQALEKQGILRKRKSYFEPNPIKVKLPSGIKVVDKKYLTDECEIFVRRFSSTEEDILGRTQTEKTVKGMMSHINEALNSVIKTNINIGQLSLIDKMSLLIFIFAVTYGNELDIADSIGECDTCVPESQKEYAETEGLTTNTVIIDLFKDLETKYVPDDFEYPFVITLESYEGSNITITVKYPTISDESIFTSEKADISSIMRNLITNIDGTKANGNKVVKQEWDDIINFLNNTDKIKIKKKIEEFGDFGLQKKCTNFNCSRGEDCSLRKKNISEIEVNFETIMSKIALQMTKDE